MAESSRTHSAGLLFRPQRVAATPLAAVASLGPVVQPMTADVSVTGVSAASADVQPGDLFAALPGSHAHGVDFLDAARAAGAVAVLTDPTGADRAARAGLPLLVVADPRAVLGAVSALVYGHPSSRLQVIGVTGTSGKTTTTSLVRDGLAAAGVNAGLIGTLGVFVGAEKLKTAFTTPEAPQLQALLAVLAERQAGVVAMEVSSHALRLGRVDGTAFAVGAFTNLSQDHLDFHTDMDDYFAAKSLLFDGRSATEIVVTDDHWGRTLVTDATVTVSTAGAGDWCVSDVIDNADGSTRFTVSGPGLKLSTGCCIPGRYNVTNMLLALAILASVGVDVARVAPVLARAGVPGRMQRVDAGQDFSVVVDYSHKPAGVTAALRALRPTTAGRLIIVLGCGGDRDRGKRPMMGEMACRAADILIVTDDNPRSEDPAAIREAMLLGAARVPAERAAEVHEIGDRRAAITSAIAMARADDTVLIAGKGHETGQQIGENMLPFDDVLVAQDALRAQDRDDLR